MELRNGRTLIGSMLALNMKGEEQRMPLPEDLVEKIIAMVPFPQIFKARALSKSWHARLAPISSHDDEEKKILAVSFQKRVCGWSDNWKAFCPVFLFGDFLITHDQASQHWRRIPFLSALPDLGAMTANSHLRCHRMETSIVGALVLFTSSYPGIMFVVNIFTGSWKDLPPLPDIHRPATSGTLVSSKETYKVISLYTDVGYACAWIYDSKLRAWRSKELEMPEILDDFEVGFSDVYLNGVLYVAVYVEELVWSFLAFDIEEETLTLIQMPATISTSFKWLQSRPLLALNGTVYIVEPRVADLWFCWRLILLGGDRRWLFELLLLPSKSDISRVRLLVRVITCSSTRREEISSNPAERSWPTMCGVMSGVLLPGILVYSSLYDVCLLLSVVLPSIQE